MKSEDIQEALRGLRKILQLYPGYSVDEIVRDIRRLKRADSSQARPNESEVTSDELHQDLDSEAMFSIDEFASNLDSLSISEIENELKSDRLFPNMSCLRYFASKIGMELGSRQARGSLIHTIKAYLDRMRIESTMAKRSE